MKEAQAYRKVMYLTELDHSRILRELESLPWSDVKTLTLGQRRVAWLRVTDLVENTIPSQASTFRYVDAMQRAPILLGVMRRVGLALGATLDDFGTAYASRMAAGDEVPPHADDYSGYYAEYHRVQIVLAQSADANFSIDGARVATQPRDCGVFDNTREHSVQAGSSERCVVLLDVRQRQLPNGLGMEFAE